MKTLPIATLALFIAFPAAALDVGFAGDADLFLDRQVFGLDLPGEGDREVVAPEGYEEAEDSPFLGEPVRFADGETPLGQVETVYEDADGSLRLVIELAEEAAAPGVEALFLSLPPGTEADGALTLNLTPVQLARIAEAWGD
ncbi:hypothetical protein [Roseicyclus sp.]|uniref:hypothetical protein n=1 Tax=Roseicyclus sp. TaxID=1914329 RepID=UPI003FA0943A